MATKCRDLKKKPQYYKNDRVTAYTLGILMADTDYAADFSPELDFLTLGKDITRTSHVLSLL